jgi:outer membrane lipoprotein SlyB
MTSRAFALPAVGLLLLLAPATAAFGDPPAPAPGDSVRVLRLDAPFLPARFDFADSASLGVFVAGEAEPRVLSRASLAGIQVRRMEGHPWRGAVIGTVLGGALAYVQLTGDDPEDAYQLAPLVGAVAGAIVGARFESERWKPADLPEPTAPMAPIVATVDSDSMGPRVGDRVRLTILAGPSRETGWLAGFDSTSLFLRFDDTAQSDTIARSIPREAIAGLEVGRRRGHAQLGAFVGGLLGLGFMGLMAGVASLESDPGTGELVAFVGLGTAASAGVGALLGGSIKSTRWRTAPLP